MSAEQTERSSGLSRVVDLLLTPADSPSEPCPASQGAPRKDEENCQIRNMRQTQNRSHKTVKDVLFEFLAVPGRGGTESSQVKDEGSSLQHAESLRRCWLIGVQKH